MNKKELLKELERLAEVLREIRDFYILKDYKDIDYYADTIKRLNERLKSILNSLIKYPEPLMKVFFLSLSLVIILD
jgi:hypothetical protein